MFDKLKAPFDPRKISWRVGSTTQDKKRGMAMAYIDARDVMDRLDEVCTPGGWQCHYPHANGKTVCEIGVKVDGEWIWKADGAGDTDFEAEKGALSDAFKRAAVRWGVGRYLYDVAASWVEIEPAGKSFRIKESELTKLAKALGGPAAPTPKPLPQHTPKAIAQGIQPPAVLAEPLATEVTEKLKADITGCVTWAELDKFWRSEGFVHRVSALPQKHQGSLRMYGKQHMAMLKDREGIAA